jgi:hypothetical protein
MGAPQEHPAFTDDEVEELKAIANDWRNTRWVGRIVWRLAVLVGSVVAGLAVFKEHLLGIFKGN